MLLRLLSLTAILAFSNFSHAVFLSCAGSGLSYSPDRVSTSDIVTIRSGASVGCGGFFGGCLYGAALNASTGSIGAKVHVQPGLIVVDLFVSDAGLPPDVTEVPATYGLGFVNGSAPDMRVSAGVQLSIGPIPEGAYVLAVRAFGLAGDGSTKIACDYTPKILNVHAAGLPAEIRRAVEFYNATKDHYFISANAQEIADLDSSTHSGWVRTGQSFLVFAPQRSAGAGVPVCRFYGLPDAAIDSHFYTSNAEECLSIPQRFGGKWIAESIDVFEVLTPSFTGTVNLPPLTFPVISCPPGSLPIYRMWNQRPDSNHRYTTDTLIAQAMVAQGWYWEGNDSHISPVPVMCSAIASSQS